MGRTIRTKEYTLFIERMKKARAELGLLQIEAVKAMKRPQSHISLVE